MRGEEGGETAVGMRKRKVGGSKGGKNLTTTTWEKRSILLGKQGRKYRGTGLLPASAQPAFSHIPGPSYQGCTTHGGLGSPHQLVKTTIKCPTDLSIGQFDQVSSSSESPSSRACQVDNKKAHPWLSS